jgi:hypothetical protein
LATLMAIVILAGFVVYSRAARTGIKFGAAMRDGSGSAYDQKAGDLRAGQD